MKPSTSPAQPVLLLHSVPFERFGPTIVNSIGYGAVFRDLAIHARDLGAGWVGHWTRRLDVERRRTTTTTGISRVKT